MVFTNAKKDRSISNLMPGNKKVGNETALEIPTQENPILEKTSSDETWKEGRRIVEFEVLSKGLMCENCKTPIHLSDIISETLSGLASILTVKCFKCGTLTKVPTGKRHRLPNERGPGRFDMNTKLAAGMFILKNIL